MSLGQRVADDHQLARLLQIAVVLEEVVEARASAHYRSLSEEARADLDEDVAALLEHAAEESAAHREELEALIAELEAESVPYEEIEELVRAQYGAPDDFDGILYDQLSGEETAYKYYDDLVDAIEDSDATFSVDTGEVLATLRSIRDDEEAGVQRVTEVMEGRE
jgi:rubrerythrin